MASGFTNRNCQWWIRQDAGANELNGGGFDATVANAGSNLADATTYAVSSATAGAF